MKKILSFLLATLMMTALLVGCGQQQTDAPGNDEPDQPALADGVYTADFNTDSSMFHANETCDGKGVLTVKDGQMTIHVSLASTSIVNLFPGLKEDAQKDGAVLLQPTKDTVTYPDGLTETQRGRRLQHAGLVGRHGDHHRLGGGDPGRQHQAVVVAMGHDDAADHPGADAPAGLVGIVGLVVPAGEGDVKGLGEAVAEVVAGAGLEGLVVVHHALHGVGLLRAVELLLVGLAALEDGHGQHVLHEVRVDVQHPHGLFPGLFGGGVHGVALLPQELPVAQEGAGGLFPPQHAAPLVVQLGQIPPGVDDVGIVLAEQRLGGGADAEPVLQLLAAAHGDPGALRRKALHVVLLLLQQGLRDQHRQVHVLMPRLLEPPVQLRLDVLPQGVAVGPVDEHALDRGIVDELRLFADVRVPLGEIHVPGRNGVHLSLILCHSLHPFLYDRAVTRRSYTLNIYCIHSGRKSQL